MPSICQRITELREFLGLNQSNFAIAINIKRPTLAGYEKGDSLPSTEFLMKIRELYNANVDWLLMGTGDMFLSQHDRSRQKTSKIMLNQIPVYNEKDIPESAFVVPLIEQRLSAGEGAFLPEEDQVTALVHVPAYLSRFGDKIAALTVDGDSMSPTLHRGDIVVCDSCGWSGDGIYALRMSGTGRVKRVTKQIGKYVILSDNKKYKPYEVSEDSQDVEIIGRVHCAITNVE